MDTGRLSNINPKTFAKTISVIHLALVAGLLVFGIAAYSITKSKTVVIKPAKDIFLVLVPVFAVINIATGTYLFKQRTKSIDKLSSLNKKLTIYQTALIIRFALAEGPALFGIVVYMITQNLFYLFLAGLIVLYFIWLSPTKEKTEQDLDLTYEDKLEMGG
jgi:hypothetical protein